MLRADTILVIEPHADDAFLSLGYHLESVWHEVHHKNIATVFPVDKGRAEEGRAFASAVNARYRCYDLVRDQSTVIDIMSQIQRDIATVKPTYIIGPLGIQHPEHCMVRKAFDQACKNMIHRQFFTPLYYVDTPYQATIKNGFEVSTLLGDVGSVFSYRHAHMSKFKHIPLFKTQSRYFFNNPKEKLHRIPEMIVRAVGLS